MLKTAFAGLASAFLVLGTATSLSAQTKEMRWGTSAVGSAGHKGLVTLAEVLNKEWTGFNVTVQPAPGAILTIKGFATNKFDGYYGADIGFYEYANDIARFKGFKSSVQRAPIQSMWVFTAEVGLGIHRRDKDKIKSWRDLNGKKAFTGPRPWDTRAQTERGMTALGIKHEYTEVDLATAGSLLDSGNIQAFGIYTNAETSVPPWITEASLTTDWIALNPNEEELKILAEKGLATTRVPASVFKKDVGTDSVVLLPFYYGFHVGLDVSEEDVYRKISIVEKNAEALAKADGSYAQIAKDMVGMQRRGIQASVEFVEIHPGLAKYMKEKNAWDPKWDSRVAKAK